MCINERHPLMDIIESQTAGIPKGIYSICSANEYVIEAAMERALADGSHVLIEATANQVNQYGGYTGMKPEDFKKFVFALARKVGFPAAKIILGGDHLGPLTWKNEDSGSAMKKANELVKQYVFAGFSKIHIDTSMHLADDRKDVRLDTKVIAERGAVLCAAVEEVFAGLKEVNSNAVHPVYVIGSEVPIPGGSQEEEDSVKVTEPDDFDETVELFRSAFFKHGLRSAWDNVIAVVVQPGVEFGDEAIHEYNREGAKKLRAALEKYPGLVLEGHSTDYQRAVHLKQMVEDRIAILKVGPALTYAMREALFALEHMERELLDGKPGVQLSNFMETLDEAMLHSTENWKKHYHGSEDKIRFARKFSLSDRCRYYLPDPEVKHALNQLVENLRKESIPLMLISQFMPIQYLKIREGVLSSDPEALLKDRIINVLDNYSSATLSICKKEMDSSG